MMTAQSSSNNNDAAIQALELFLGESAGNLPDGNNVNIVFSKWLSHWTDSGFHHESEVVVSMFLLHLYIKRYTIPFIYGLLFTPCSGSLGGTTIITCLCKNIRRFRECHFTFVPRGDSKRIF